MQELRDERLHFRDEQKHVNWDFKANSLTLVSF